MSVDHDRLTVPFGEAWAHKPFSPAQVQSVTVQELEIEPVTTYRAPRNLSVALFGQVIRYRKGQQIEQHHIDALLKQGVELDPEVDGLPSVYLQCPQCRCQFKVE